MSETGRGSDSILSARLQGLAWAVLDVAAAATPAPLTSIAKRALARVPSPLRNAITAHWALTGQPAPLAGDSGVEDDACVASSPMVLAATTSVLANEEPSIEEPATEVPVAQPEPTRRTLALPERYAQILACPGIVERLRAIDAALSDVGEADIPSLFSDVPLEVFGLLLLDDSNAFPNIAAYFPDMPSPEFQERWVGSSGVELLSQGLRFIRSVTASYERHGAKPLASSRVLDYGVGWGRLLRLMYKLVPERQLYGVDGWQAILDVARGLRVRGTLLKIDEYPEDILDGVRFDLVYQFSVFTHLSELAHHKALRAIHRSLEDDGVLIVTVRPSHYWTNADHPDAPALDAQHRERGFAYSPHGGPASGPGGDVPYGDTSIGLAYIERNWTGWRIVDTDFNLCDPYQFIVILKKA